MDLAANIESKAGNTICPLCGFQFAKAQAACGGCAMMRGCSMLKCPNCHYEFVTESKVAGWFAKFFGREKEDGR